MPNVRGVRRYLLPAVAGLLAIAAGAATPAGASFGELARFGGAKQFVEAPTTVAFGVDPTDNSYYVGDEPEANVFRVQKFNANGELQGAGQFKFKGSGPEPESGIEGIAISHTEGRVYLLGLASRGDEEQVEVDPETLAAGTLFAFKMEPNGEKKLEPATGTTGEGVLVGAAKLHAQSKVLGEALLEPSGISVDPKTGDVIIAGKEDRGESVETPLRVALERVSNKGVVGARWVDTAAEPFFPESEATSPVVSNGGRVFVLGGGRDIERELENEKVEEIDAIPASFQSGEAPTPIVRYNPGPGVSFGGLGLVTFPGSPPSSFGGGLSLDPATGNLWAYAGIEREVKSEPEPKFEHERGAVEFNELGSEIGWTGGEVWSQSSEPKCAISFLGRPTVAVGKEGVVFIFDSNPEAPRVLKFGSGGSGCPAASADAPIATVSGTQVPSVKPNVEAVFKSRLKVADALTVEWNFGDGTAPQKVNTDGYQSPQIAHKFAHSGKFTITETIHTDNLATPEITKSIEFTVEPGPPLAAFKAPEELKPGQTAEFDAKGSSDPNGSALTKYAWDFGDGASETTTTPAAKHTYGSAGNYTVTLLVTDALSLTSLAATHVVRVASPSPPAPPPVTPPPFSPPSPPSSAPPVAATTGAGASVLSYIVRVASTSLKVSRAGAVLIKVDCAGNSACTGAVTLRTLGAVSAGGKKKAVLTLASGSFALTSGHFKVLTLHLSTKARQLLKRSHALKARATIVAHDSRGRVHTTVTVVTLRVAKH